MTVTVTEDTTLCPNRRNLHRVSKGVPVSERKLFDGELPNCLITQSLQRAWSTPVHPPAVRYRSSRRDSFLLSPVLVAQSRRQTGFSLTMMTPGPPERP